MAKFDNEKVIERLRQAINYHRHPIITNFDQSTIFKLQKGIAYTFGYDKGMRPIIVLKMDQVDFQDNFHNMLNPYYFIMLIVYTYRMVPYHAEKVTFIVDLLNVSLRNIPLFSLYEDMKKMGMYYCGVT